MSKYENIFNDLFIENLKQTLEKFGFKFSIQSVEEVDEVKISLNFLLKNSRQNFLILSVYENWIEFRCAGHYIPIEYEQSFTVQMMSFFLKRNSFLKYGSWILQPSGNGFSADCRYSVALPAKLGSTLDVNFIAEVIREIVKEVDDFHVRMMISNFNWGDFRNIENAF